MTSDLTLHPLRACRDGGPPAAGLGALLDGRQSGGYLELEPAATLRCRPPAWSDHAEPERRFFFAGKAEDAFDLDYRFPAAYLAVLPRARLVGRGWVVVAGDHHVITDSYSGRHVLEIDGRFQSRTLHVDVDGRRRSLPFVLARRRDLPREMAGTCILPAHYWHFNYHHWLVECLPRLRAALDVPELASHPVVVPADLAPFQRESLDLLGLPPERRLPFDERDWRFETLVFPSIGSFSPSELRWLRERLSRGPGAGAAAAGTSSGPGSRRTRLYVSRADAATRRPLNEADLVAALEPYGFEVLMLTGMPLSEQIRRFAEAAIVVGPHGSGLTNLLFAPPGATLVELMPNDEVNHCFWLMANVLGQRYTFVSGPVSSPQRDFSIAPERLRAVIAAGLAAEGSRA